MKAVELRSFGGPEALVVVDAPVPTPGQGEVLIRVEATGVNFADTLMRQDKYAMTPPLPSVLGSEVAGVIEALGPGVEGHKVGDRVAGAMFAANQYFGGYAEFAICPAAALAPLPAAVSAAQAVALMVQGLTAQHLLRQAPATGKQVLVSAAAGGVGSFLVQLARRAGARQVIAAASSAEKRDFAISLGAHSALDYTAAGWSERARELTGGAGVDVVYESVGGSVTQESLRALGQLGRLVIFGALNIQSFSLGVPELLPLIFGNQSVTGFALVPLLMIGGSLRDDLSELFALTASGELKVTIGGTYPLAEAGAAHTALESRGTRGKVILVP